MFPGTFSNDTFPRDMSSPAGKAASPAKAAATLDGTQAIRRAVSMLKIIASGGRAGITLSHVSKAMQLPRSTTHRILKYLAAEGLIEQEPTHHGYSIGPLAFELGLAVVRDFHGTTQWSGLVDTVAQRTKHTAYLLARSGTDSVCIHKAESRGALRVVPVDVGQRRPLGVGAGSLALLSSFEPDEIVRIVSSIAPSLSRYPHLSADIIIQDALTAKERGFAVSRGRVFSEVVGIGFVLPPTTQGRVAMSIAAPASMLDAEMIVRLAATIRTSIDAAL